MLVPKHYRIQQISDLAVLISADDDLSAALEHLAYIGIHAVEIDPRTAALLLRNA